MAFDLDGALRAGHSASEIAEFLASRTGMDLAGARSAGHSDEEIARFLAQRVAGGQAAAAPAADAPRSAPPPARTAGQEALRGLGVGTRGAMHMVGALPGALYDVASLPVRGVAALTGMPQPRSSAEMIDSVADRLGLPQPQGSTERMINRVGTEVGAMGVGMGVGQGLRRAAAALPSGDRFARGARVVGDALASSPGAQTAGAVGAGLAGGAVSEATDSPLADFGASLGGGLAGAAAVPILAGTARGLATIPRMFTQSGAEEAAAAALLRASDDPTTLPQRLGRQYRGLEDSAPTAGELAGDSGLLQLERAVRNQPEGGPLFNARDMARDAARGRAIEDLAPGLPGEGSGAEQVARGVGEATGRARAGAQAAEEAAVAAAEARAAGRVAGADAALARRQGRVETVNAGRGQQVAGSLDRLPPGVVPEAAGPIIREEADAAERAAKEGLNQTFGRIDPEGESRLPLASILRVIEETRDRLFRPLGAKVPREIEQVVDDLRAALSSDTRAGTAPFDDLSALRSHLNDLMGKFSGSSAGNSRAVAVLRAAKEEVDAVSRRAAEPFELPTQRRTEADIGAEEALEAAAQHPDVVRALDEIAGDPRAWSAGPQPDGPNMLAFLRQLGGVRNTGGEMRHMMSNGRAFPGLWNNRGLTIDRAMEQAIEAGYFPGHDLGSLTQTEFLDAMREGLRGRHRFPGGTGGGGVATATRGAFTDDVAREIEARGGRFVPGDPDATLASLRQATDDPSTAAFQPGDPPPGQPGFVVDPQAEGWAFTPDMAARYRAAIEQGADYAQRFKQGATARVLGRGEGGSRSAESSVASQYFHGGDSGASDIQNFIATIGDRPRAAAALEGYAAQSLRDYAWGSDGKLTASRVRAWLNRHGAALRQWPELTDKFRDVEAAVRTAEGSAARGEDLLRSGQRGRDRVARAAESDRRGEVRAAARDARRTVQEFEQGAARYWLNGTEPEVAIERALSAGNAEQNIRQLRVMMRGDVPALRGLRRAYAEVWLSRVQNTMAQHADESRRLRADASRRWVDETERAARALFQGDELERIQQIARDFSSGAMITSVGRAVGSNTAQNLASLRSMSTAYLLGRVTQGVIRGDAGGLPMTLARPIQWLARQPEEQVVAALADLMLDPQRAAALTEKVTAKNLEMVRRYAERRAGARLGDAALATGVRTAARAAGSAQAGEAQREARAEEPGFAVGGMVDPLLAGQEGGADAAGGIGPGGTPGAVSTGPGGSSIGWSGPSYGAMGGVLGSMAAGALGVPGLGMVGGGIGGYFDARGANASLAGFGLPGVNTWDAVTHGATMGLAGRSAGSQFADMFAPSVPSSLSNFSGLDYGGLSSGGGFSPAGQAEVAGLNDAIGAGFGPESGGWGGDGGGGMGGDPGGGEAGVSDGMFRRGGRVRGYAFGGMADEPRVAVRREMAGLSGRGPYDDGRSAVGRFMLPADDDPEAVERIPRARFQVPYTAAEREDVADNVSIAPAGVSGRRPILAGGARMPTSAEGPAIVNRGIEGALDLASEFLVPGPMDAALAIAAPQLAGGRVAARVLGGLGRVGLDGWRARGALAGGVAAMEPGEGEAGVMSRGLGAALRAYHGSPHAFERFSLDHIGRGEGAQAYGHGLYFAENEDVARHYRDALARTSRAYNALDGQRFTDAVRRRVEAEDPELAEFMRTWVPARYQNSERLLPHLRDLRRSVDEQLGMFRERRADRVRSDEAEAAGAPRSLGGWTLEDYDARIGGLESRAAELGRVMPRFQRVPERRHAHMYEVNLHVDPDRLLDWDAPLASQPAAVRESVVDVARDFVDRLPDVNRAAVRGRFERLATDDTIRGGDALRTLGGDSIDMLGGSIRVFGDRPVSPQGASEALLERGIPGVRYLDGVSRRTGEGNRNFVMFDDEPVEIIRRYRRGGLAGI
jgi:hypothetical protein